MEETSQYTRRLRAIAEKRKVQEEIDKKHRELEEERLKLQQLKRKSLRDRWLMEGTSPPDQENDQKSPLGQSEACIQELQEQLASLKSQMNRLENHSSDSAAHRKAPEQIPAAKELGMAADTVALLPMDTSTDLHNNKGSEVSPGPPHGETIQENAINLHVNGALAKCVGEQATVAASSEEAAHTTNPTIPRPILEHNDLRSKGERAGPEHFTAVPPNVEGNQENNTDAAKTENRHPLEKGEDKEELLEYTSHTVAEISQDRLTQSFLVVDHTKAPSEELKRAEGSDVEDASVDYTRVHRLTEAQLENSYVSLVSKGTTSIAVAQTETGLEGVIRAERVIVTEDGEEVLVKSLEGYVPTAAPDIVGTPEQLQGSKSNGTGTGNTNEMELTSDEMHKTLIVVVQEQVVRSTHREDAVGRLQEKMEPLKSNLLMCQGEMQELGEDAATFQGQKAAIPEKMGTFLEERLSISGEMPTQPGEVSAVPGQIPAAQGKISVRQEQLPSWQGQVPALQEQILDLIEQPPSIQKKISAVQDQIPSIQDHITSMQEQIPGLKASIQEQMPSIQNHMSSIQEQIPGLQASIQEQIPSLQASIQEQIPGLQASIQEQILGLQESIQEQIPGLHASIQEQIPGLKSSIQEQIPSIQNHITSIQEQIPGLQASIQDQIISIQGQIPGLKASIQDQIPGLHASIQKQSPSFQEQITSIQEQISTVQCQIPSIQETISTIQEQIPSIHDQIPPIQNHITSIQEQIPRLHTSIQEQIPGLHASIQNQTPSLQASIQEQIPGLQASIKEKIPSIQDHITSIQEQIPSIQNHITSIQEQIPGLQASSQKQIPGLQEGNTVIKVAGDLVPRSAVAQKVLEDLSPEQQPLLQEVNLSEIQASAIQDNIQLRSKSEITKPLITKSQEGPTHSATSANTAQGSSHRNTEARADGPGPDRPKQKTCQCCSVM